MRCHAPMDPVWVDSNCSIPQATWYWIFTLFWEFCQCICNHLTNIPIPSFEEDFHLWNGRPNWVLKLSYHDYINNVQVKVFDTLPCSRSFANAFTTTFRTSQFPYLRMVIICGMAGLIDSRNSATSTSTMFKSESLIPYLALRVSSTHL